jgi:hypothetical protein
MYTFSFFWMLATPANPIALIAPTWRVLFANFDHVFSSASKNAFRNAS